MWKSYISKPDLLSFKTGIIVNFYYTNFLSRCKTLVAINNYSLLFRSKTLLKNADKKYIEPDQITALAAFKNMTKADWHNAAAVLVSSVIKLDYDRMNFLPMSQLGRDVGSKAIKIWHFHFELLFKSSTFILSGFWIFVTLHPCRSSSPHRKRICKHSRVLQIEKVVTTFGWWRWIKIPLWWESFDVETTL